MSGPGEIKPDWLKFSVDSQLVGELGQRLVARDYVALSELVKNSYDADATQVTITFENAALGPGLGRIIISDNGHGMNFQQVKDFWMRVATPNKNIETETPLYGRQKAWSKGIGRFACQRLSESLELETVGRTEGGKLEKTLLQINWGDFRPGTDLTEIPCRVEHKARTDATETGLSLRLEGLRDIWGEGEFNVLRRQLLTLTIAKGEQRGTTEGDPGFDVVLMAPEFEFLKKYVSDKQLRIMIQLGLALRRLQADPKAEPSFQSLRNNLRSVFGLPGLHIAELVSNGVVTTYLNLLVGTQPTAVDVSTRLDRFLRQADSFVLFVVSSTPAEQTLEKIRARLLAHGPGTVAIFAKGTSRKVLNKVLTKLKRDPEGYIIDIVSSGDSTIALVSTPEAWFETDELEPPRALVRRKPKG